MKNLRKRLAKFLYDKAIQLNPDIDPWAMSHKPVEAKVFYKMPQRLCCSLEQILWPDDTEAEINRIHIIAFQRIADAMARGMLKKGLIKFEIDRKHDPNVVRYIGEVQAYEPEEQCQEYAQVISKIPGLDNA